MEELLNLSTNGLFIIDSFLYLDSFLLADSDYKMLDLLVIGISLALVLACFEKSKTIGMFHLDQKADSLTFRNQSTGISWIGFLKNVKKV